MSGGKTGYRLSCLLMHLPVAGIVWSEWGDVEPGRGECLKHGTRWIPDSRCDGQTLNSGCIQWALGIQINDLDPNPRRGTFCCNWCGDSRADGF